MTNMIATSKNKIVEVLAHAREVSIRHGHTRKYAKHLVWFLYDMNINFNTIEKSNAIK